MPKRHKATLTDRERKHLTPEQLEARLKEMFEGDPEVTDEGAVTLHHTHRVVNLSLDLPGKSKPK
jgi:hypothetical protein